MKHRAALTRLLSALLFTVGTSIAFAQDWSISTELNFVDISGIRTYGATNIKGFNSSETESLTTPSITLSYAFSDRFSANIMYSDFQDLNGIGVSNNSDIFREQEFALDVISPYSIEEAIQEIAAAFDFALINRNHWSIKLSAILSNYSSKAIVAGRHFSETDLRFGGGIKFIGELSSSWNWHIGLRYSTPPEREIRILSIGAGYRF